MLKGWKTVIFSAATALFGVAQTTDWASVTNNPKVSGAIIAGIGVANMALRYFTTTPVGQSTPKA